MGPIKLAQMEFALKEVTKTEICTHLHSIFLNRLNQEIRIINNKTQGDKLWLTEEL